MRLYSFYTEKVKPSVILAVGIGTTGEQRPILQTLNEVLALYLFRLCTSKELKISSRISCLNICKYNENP